MDLVITAALGLVTLFVIISAIGADGEKKMFLTFAAGVLMAIGFFWTHGFLD
jgi:hypothetical protein